MKGRDPFALKSDHENFSRRRPGLPPPPPLPPPCACRPGAVVMTTSQHFSMVLMSQHLPMVVTFTHQVVLLLDRQSRNWNHAVLHTNTCSQCGTSSQQCWCAHQTIAQSMLGAKHVSMPILPPDLKRNALRSHSCKSK